MTALKNIPTLIGVAAVIAATAIGLTTASASAKWDLDAYVKCMKRDIVSAKECCMITGGVVTANGGCGIPADGVAEQVTETPPTSPFTIGTLAPVATDAPVGPAPGRGGIFVTPSGGVAAP